MKYLVMAISFLTLTAFAQTAGTEQLREEKAITALKVAAKALSVQDLSCRSNAECIYVSLGRKACGGPTGYLVASKRNHNYSSVLTLARSSRINEHKFNQRWDIISDCLAQDPPKPRCVSRVCKDISSP